VIGVDLVRAVTLEGKFLRDVGDYIRLAVKVNVDESRPLLLAASQLDQDA